jgi:hypothetical protein
VSAADSNRRAWLPRGSVEPGSPAADFRIGVLAAIDGPV